MTTIMPHTRESEGDGPEGYAEWTKDELQAELEKRDLPKSGNKDELIARLEEDDAA
jgi:hypothetical protein